MSPFVLFGAMALVVVAVAVLGSWLKAKRRKELAAWAATRGLRFSAGNRQPGHRWSRFPCLQQGANRYAYNMMEGDWSGRTIAAFDWHYETYSHGKHGRRTHHHHFSAVVLESSVPLRPLAIRPENVLDKIAGALGFDDIDFESAEFSRRFHVSSPDRKWAYDVLHARAMEHLLRMPAFHVQFDGEWAIAWRSSTFSVLDFTAAAEVIRGVLDRLPEYVVRQQGQEA